MGHTFSQHFNDHFAPTKGSGDKISISKQQLFIGRDDPIPVVHRRKKKSGVVSQTLTVTNDSNITAYVSIELPVDNRFEISASSPQLKLKKQSKTEITFHVRAFCTLNYRGVINIKIKLRKRGKPMRYAIPLHLSSQKSDSLDASEIFLLEEKGTGGQGTVYRALYRGQEVAVKKLDNNFNISHMFFEQERKFLELCQGDFVCKYVGTTNRIAGQYKSIVMEYIKWDLAYVLGKEELLSNQIKLKFALDVAKGLQHLHSNGVYHRDIKASNCLVVSTEMQKVNVKITDLGSANTQSNRFLHSHLNKAPGTVTHQAPEGYLSHEEYSLAQAETFSFGVLLWEIFTQEEPYKGFSVDKTKEFVMEGRRLKLDSPRIPTNVRRLIHRCWKQDPSQRPPMSLIVTKLESFLEDLSE